MTSNYFVKLHFNQAIAQKTNYAFKVGDKGCTFHLHCEDHDPTDMLPHIVFNRSDGTCVEGTPTGSGRDYTYTVQGNEFGVCGKTVVDLKFYDADPATQRISTASFIIDVIPDTLTPFDTPPSPYADSLEQAKEELEDATEDLANMDSLFAQTLQDYIDAFGNTAPINPRGAYDPDALYNPRDAVFYTVNNKTVTYINNIECTGVLPTESSNWQPLFDIAVIPAIIDNCESTSATDALAANQGRLIADNLAAIENVYSAKNLNSLPYYETAKSENGITITSDDKGIVTASGTAAAVVALYMHSDTIPTNKLVLPKGDYTLLGCPVGGSQDTYCLRVNFGGTQYYDVGSGVNFSLLADTQIEIAVIIKSGTVLPIGGITIKPMICDARVIDPTFTPFAKTNLQLTNDKAERNDLSTIHATGSTNTTGAQIEKDALFYLNRTLCKALTNIAANATFTLNTNYKVDSVGKELKTITYNSPIRKGLDAGSSVSYTVPNGVYLVTSWQAGASAAFSGLWIAFVTPYATGCSVFPLVTPYYITVSVNADTITISNSDSLYIAQTNITCITEAI